MSKAALKEFEQNMKQLQDLVAFMESPNATLSQSLEAYEKGVKLINDCQKALSEVEHVITKINHDNSQEEFLRSDEAAN